MLSLMNKCYRIYIACILFINMKYTFGMLLLKNPVVRITRLGKKLQVGSAWESTYKPLQNLKIGGSEHSQEWNF